MNDSWLETLAAAVRAGPGVGSTLLVAVSGGADSLALLHGLVRLRGALGLRLVAGHLDHALRPDSAADAAFVGAVAQELALPCLRERREVAAWAAAQRLNVEQAARLLRYETLEAAAQAVRADAIALAHTADDQAETLLMHLLRGAGLEGLRGMAPLGPSPLPGATVPLFRPLLAARRAPLRDWLRGAGVAWREDPTNQDRARTRSRLRHHLIPLLAAEQPSVVERLARTAQLLALDHAWLEGELDRAWERLAHLEGERLSFPRAALLAEPLALRRRLLRRAVALLRPHAELSAAATDAALALAERGHRGQRAPLAGGLSLLVARGLLHIEAESAPQRH